MPCFDKPQIQLRTGMMSYPFEDVNHLHPQCCRHSVWDASVKGLASGCKSTTPKPDRLGRRWEVEDGMMNERVGVVG